VRYVCQSPKTGKENISRSGTCFGFSRWCMLYDQFFFFVVLLIEIPQGFTLMSKSREMCRVGDMYDFGMFTIDLGCGWVGFIRSPKSMSIDWCVHCCKRLACLAMKNELSLILSLSLPSKLVVGTRPRNISLGNYSALMFPKRPVRLHSSLPLGYMISNNTQVMVPGNLWPRMICQAPM